jgi:hypothetical protein
VWQKLSWAPQPGCLPQCSSSTRCLRDNFNLNSGASANLCVVGGVRNPTRALQPEYKQHRTAYLISLCHWALVDRFARHFEWSATGCSVRHLVTLTTAPCEVLSTACAAPTGTLNLKFSVGILAVGCRERSSDTSLLSEVHQPEQSVMGCSGARIRLAPAPPLSL